MFSITYLSSFKLYNNWQKPGQEYIRLLVNNEKAISQTHNVMVLDSLLLSNKATDSDKGKYFSFNQTTIEFQGDTVNYLQLIGKYYYNYKEVLDFNWKLEKETKMIGGYKCNKARLEYGGRNWTAWYSTEIPVPYGPYKFKGLPGLIIKMFDDSLSYDFELYGIVEADLRPLKKLYPIPENKIIKTTQADFILLSYRFENLSIGEKLNFSSDIAGKREIRMVGGNTDESFRDVAKNDITFNFIELLPNN